MNEKGKRLIRTGLTIAGLLALKELSQSAFTISAKHEMFKRDKGVCQCPDCIGYYIEGYPRSTASGWHGQLAHYPEYHQRDEDDNTEHGRFLCTHCHIVEEIDRNSGGERLLYASQSIRNYDWQARNRSEDQKPPIDFFYDWAVADTEGKKGLAQAYAENYMGNTPRQPRLI